MQKGQSGYERHNIFKVLGLLYICCGRSPKVGRFQAGVFETTMSADRSSNFGCKNWHLNLLNTCLRDDRKVWEKKEVDIAENGHQSDSDVFGLQLSRLLLWIRQYWIMEAQRFRLRVAIASGNREQDWLEQHASQAR